MRVLYLFFSIKLRKFWHTARLSRTNRHKVIKSENSPFFWPTLYSVKTTGAVCVVRMKPPVRRSTINCVLRSRVLWTPIAADTPIHGAVNAGGRRDDPVRAVGHRRSGGIRATAPAVLSQHRRNRHLLRRRQPRQLRQRLTQVAARGTRAPAFLPPTIHTRWAKNVGPPTASWHNSVKSYAHTPV